MWTSPSSTIRNHVNGTIFREPIRIASLPGHVPGWVNPIIVARHAFSEHTLAKDSVADYPGKVQIVYTPADGSAPVTQTIHEFGEGEKGVFMGMFNSEHSIRSFAKACMKQAL